MSDHDRRAAAENFIRSAESDGTKRIREDAEAARRRVAELTGFGQGVDDPRSDPAPPDEPPPNQGGLSNADLLRLRELLTERRNRRYESLKLWQPMPTQAEFHKCTARERIVYGSNRAGKTTTAAVEVSRVVLNLHEQTGKLLPKKGVFVIVGYDEGHLGRVCYKKLFTEGAYRLIRDPATKVPRPFLPDQDAAIRGQSYPAPPLIPKRFVADIAWNKKNKSIPSIIRLTTGWELWFVSSKAPPPAGFACDAIWFDEEIENEKWYSEAAARLVDNEGIFIWSATPLVGGDDLVDLHNRAVEQLEQPDALTREFFLSIDGNAFLSDAAKEVLKAKYRDKPEEYRVRILGEFAAKAFKVYPEFNANLHCFDPAAIWKSSNGYPPSDWCRYLAIDPGHQVAAVSFLAVAPPDAVDQRWFIYDEIHLEKTTATALAEEVERKTRHQSIEAVLLDMQAGQQQHAGQVEATHQIYHKALSSIGPDKINFWDRCRIKGFIPGTNKVEVRVSAVKEALVFDHSRGFSRLTFAKGRLPYHERGFDKYQNKKVGGEITDTPRRKWNDEMDCLGYLVCFKPTWQEPAPASRPKSRALLRLQEKRARVASAAPEVVRFGPQSS